MGSLSLNGRIDIFLVGDGFDGPLGHIAPIGRNTISASNWQKQRFQPQQVDYPFLCNHAGLLGV